MMVQVVNPTKKQLPKDDDDSPEEFIIETKKTMKKLMGVSCVLSLILYALSISLLLVVSIRDGSKEKKQTVSCLLMMNMYAIMLQIASLFMPTDDSVEDNNSRCLKYTKLIFTFVSIVTHFTGLALFTILISYGDDEILVAIVFQIVGFVIEGFYFRTVIAAVFSEEGFDFHTRIPYDSSPMFGIV